jgi:hypothetical protein
MVTDRLAQTRRHAAALKGDIWATLSQVDVSEHIEKKAGFSYLSWPWAWALVVDRFPDATFEKHLFGDDHQQLPYMVDNAGWAYVQVTVTILHHSLTEIYPVLNHSNRPIKNPDSFAINTALMRGLVKTLAYHGLGISLYVGEDLPLETKSKKFNVAEVIDDEELPAKPAGKTPRQTPTRVGTRVGNGLISSLQAIKTLSQLETWARDSTAEVNQMRRSDLEAWTRVKDAYETHLRKLQAKEAK